MQKQLFAIASLSLVVFLASTKSVAGQYYGTGKCPEVKVVPNFDLSKYLRSWVVYENNAGSLVTGSHCLLAIYGPKISSTQFKMVSSRLDGSNQKIDIEGSGTLIGNARILVNINFGSFGNTFNDYVIATDYKNYAVVFNCEETENGNTQNLSILTGSRNPSARIVKIAKAAIKAQGLTMVGMQKENQTNCAQLN